MKKQSAVEYLLTEIANDKLLLDKSKWKYIKNKAKHIEYEQQINLLKWIEGSYSFGNVAGKWYRHSDGKDFTIEQLIELFKQPKKD
ncbi:MAG: hypothetical protein RLZ10_632 [Bacteroidota bacterium]|jgi:hypothetical protein